VCGAHVGLCVDWTHENASPTHAARRCPLASPTAHRARSTSPPPFPSLQASTSAPTNGAAAAAAPAPPAAPQSSSSSLSSAAAAAGGQSEFARRAAAIGAGIHSTSGRLAALAALARRTATFDDPAAEVAELSARVKRDIHSLNAALAELQGLSTAPPAAAAAAAAAAPRANSAHAAAHSKAVVDSLRGRLKDAASEFRDVLGARQAALAAHAGRRELFSAPVPGTAPAPAPRPPGPAASPPPLGSTSPNVLTHRGGHGASPASAPAPPPSARPLFGGAAAGAAAGRAPLFAGRAAPGAAAAAASSSETYVTVDQQHQQQAQQHPLRHRRVPGAFGAGDGRCVFGSAARPPPS